MTRHRVEHFGDIGRGPTRIACLRVALEMLGDMLAAAKRRHEDRQTMQSPAPDGINRQNERNSGGPSPLPILFLGAILTAGLAGLFGGQSDPVREVRDNDTTLSVRAPTTLRNGMLDL